MPIKDNQKSITNRPIDIDGQQIPVMEDVYCAFKRPDWAEHKRKEREKRCRDKTGKRCTKSCRICDLERAEKGLPPIERTGSVLSLDKFTEDGFEVADPVDLAELVADKLLLEQLAVALDELEPDERSLISALFCKDRTERDYAAEIGISHQAVGKRKHKIIKKLRGIMCADK